MKAEYIPHIAYPGNPFIEALPAKLTQEELYRQITSLPEYNSAAVRLLDAEERLCMTSNILDLFLPMDYALTIYHSLYRGMERSFLSRQNLISVREMQRRSGKIRGKDYSNYYSGQNNGFSVLGVPGTGKTTTISHILTKIPQVITHEEYYGVEFEEVQINHIRVQCPCDCSVKSLCLYIINEIFDAVMMATGQELRIPSRTTLDILVLQIGVLCNKYHVGTIIIDEIQNVIAHTRKTTISISDNVLIDFLVQLMNSTGVCIVLVGTPEISEYFSKELHLFRRTRGIKIPALEYDKEFNTLLNCMWEYQYTDCYSILNDNIRKMIYKVTNGIPALMSMLLLYSQEIAITENYKHITAEVISKASHLFQMQSGPTPVLRIGKLAEPKRTSANISPSEILKKGRPAIHRDEQDLIALYESTSSADGFISLLLSHKLIRRGGQNE